MPLPIAGIGAIALMSQAGGAAATGWTTGNVIAASVTSLGGGVALAECTRYLIGRRNQQDKNDQASLNGNGTQLGNLEAEQAAHTPSEISEKRAAKSSQTLDSEGKENNQIIGSTSDEGEERIALEELQKGAARSSQTLDSGRKKDNQVVGSTSDKGKKPITLEETQKELIASQKKNETLEEEKIALQEEIKELKAENQENKKEIKDLRLANQVQQETNQVLHGRLDALFEELNDLKQHRSSSRATSRSSRSRRSYRSDTSSIRTESRPVSPINPIDVPIHPTLSAYTSNPAPAQHPSFYFGPSLVNQPSMPPTVAAESEYGHLSEEERADTPLSSYDVIHAERASYVAASSRSLPDHYARHLV